MGEYLWDPQEVRHGQGRLQQELQSWEWHWGTGFEREEGG